MIFLNEDIAVSESGLIYNHSTCETFTVNPMGLLIIRLLKIKMDEQYIIETICNEFDVSVKDANMDVMSFINFLIEYKVAAYL